MHGPKKQKKKSPVLLRRLCYIAVAPNQSYNFALYTVYCRYVIFKRAAEGINVIDVYRYLQSHAAH